MDFFTRFYEAYSRPIKRLRSRYPLRCPQILRIESLLYIGEHPASRTRFTPQVAVALLSATLTGTTIALATRCVDESLWKHLAPSTAADRITVAESCNLALWSISAVARIRHVFIPAVRGRSVSALFCCWLASLHYFE
ncbi:hypothetical protein GTR04_5998 [Trichophyton interdigitale]|nr:hypothetical protein GY631_5847 [Trichophyton interdigitale]KAG5218219.1 hypothetical protein GY632_5776 [Trichophyton interdigitale]KAG8206630.1 hypothetical protein GTR04_5998 [Trichophyton interdigitale]